MKGPPFPEMKRSDTIEKKHKEIVDTLNGFFESKGYKDGEGSPVRMGEVHWPTAEDEAAYKKIQIFLASDEFRKYAKENIKALTYDEAITYLALMAKFLHQAATFDSMKKKSDHTLRREIENALPLEKLAD